MQAISTWRASRMHETKLIALGNQHADAIDNAENITARNWHWVQLGTIVDELTRRGHDYTATVRCPEL